MIHKGVTAYPEEVDKSNCQTYEAFCLMHLFDLITSSDKFGLFVELLKRGDKIICLWNWRICIILNVTIKIYFFYCNIADGVAEKNVDENKAQNTPEYREENLSWPKY